MAQQLGAYWSGNTQAAPGEDAFLGNIDSRSTGEKVAMGAGFSSVAPLIGPASIPMVVRYLGNQKRAKAAKEAAKNTAAKQQLSGIAGEEGAAYGYTAPEGSKHNRAAWNVAQQEAHIAHDVGTVNESYGYLPTMAGAQNSDVYRHALGSKAILEGEINHAAGGVRDAGTAANVSGSEANARAAAQAAAESGMTGGSVDQRAKQQVLGGYLSGRQDVALQTGQMRTDARNQLDTERQQQLGIVRSGGTSPALGEEIAGTQTLDALGQARSQLLGQAIGGTIGAVGSTAVQGYLTGQQQDAQARMYGGAGATMPRLSSGASRPVGGLTPLGTR